MTDEKKQQIIKALLREREGYEVRGDAQGIADVNAELRRLGAEGAPPVKRAAKRSPRRVEE